MVDGDSFLNFGLLLFDWSLDLHLVHGVRLEDLSDLECNLRKSFLHGLVELLLELLLEPLLLLVLEAVLELLPEGELAAATTGTVVLFLLLVEGSELLSKLWSSLDQVASPVDLLLDGDLKDDPRLEVFRLFERKKVSLNVVKVDFSLRALHSGLHHEIAAVILHLFEVYDFEDFESFRVILLEALLDGSDLALDATFELPKNLKWVVLLGVGIEPVLPLGKLKGFWVKLVLRWRVRFSVGVRLLFLLNFFFLLYLFLSDLFFLLVIF